MNRPSNAPVRAMLAGVVCLAILGGMIVGHAWPLWRGQVVLMSATPVDPRDLFRGEFVRLAVPATTLRLAAEGDIAAPGEVRPVGKWWDSREEAGDHIAGAVVYVQLEPVDGGPEVGPVSISRARVAGALNLRGRVRSTYGGGTIRVDYGLDAFYMQEGTAKPVEDALREGRRVQMEVAIASSGRARIRNLVIDGTPLPRP